jgi:hypothetical protein
MANEVAQGVAPLTHLNVDIITFLTLEWNAKWFKFMGKVRRYYHGQDGISKNSNLSMNIVDENPNHPWHWFGMSSNPNLTFDMVLKHPDKSWNWHEISEHPNITPKMMEDHPEIPWTKAINYNPNVTLEIMEKFIKQNYFGWLKIKNKGLQLDIWHYSANRNLTFEFVKKHSSFDWNMKFLSNNLSISLETINSHPSWKWNYGLMSGRNDISMNYVLRNMDKPWSWYRLSIVVPIKNIVARIDWYPWNWRYVSANPTLTIDVVLMYPYIDWDWYEISRNPNITMETIKKHRNLPWRWSAVYENPNLTMKFIRDNSNFPWTEIGIDYAQFSIEKQKHIKHHFYFVLLFNLCECYENKYIVDLQPVDFIFCNGYLLEQVIKYVL